MIDFPVSFTSKEITPWGGMAFLKQMLDKMRFSELVSGCEHLPVSGSNRGYAPEVILESFIASIWCGANRFMHTELTRLDPALARIFGWKNVPAQDVFKRYFSKFDLITNVLVEKANIPDIAFVEPAIQASIEVTGQKIEKIHADGAYQSPANEKCCENIDMVFTGIQGFESNYDLEMTPTGLQVTNNQTGEVLQAVAVKKYKNSKEDRWRITTPNGYYYFGQQAIRTSNLRREMKKRPLEELRKRNNVEVTIFQFGIPLKNGKSKYRGHIK